MLYCANRWNLKAGYGESLLIPSVFICLPLALSSDFLNDMSFKSLTFIWDSPWAWVILPQCKCKTKNWFSDSSALVTKLQSSQEVLGKGFLFYDFCKVNVYVSYWLNVLFHKLLENVGFPWILPPLSLLKWSRLALILEALSFECCYLS